jgi:hypothetical protein
VSGQLHDRACLTPGERAPVPIGYKAGWSPEPVWTIWRSENSRLYRVSNSDPSVVQPVVSRYTYCTAVTPIIIGRAACYLQFASIRPYFSSLFLSNVRCLGCLVLNELGKDFERSVSDDSMSAHKRSKTSRNIHNDKPQAAEARSEKYWGVLATRICSEIVFICGLFNRAANNSKRIME